MERNGRRGRESESRMGGWRSTLNRARARIGTSFGVLGYVCTYVCVYECMNECMNV